MFLVARELSDRVNVSLYFSAVPPPLTGCGWFKKPLYGRKLLQDDFAKHASAGASKVSYVCVEKYLSLGCSHHGRRNWKRYGWGTNSSPSRSLAYRTEFKSVCSEVRGGGSVPPQSDQKLAP